MASTKSSTGVHFTPLDSREDERLDAAQRVGRQAGRNPAGGGEPDPSGRRRAMAKEPRASRSSGDDRQSDATPGNGTPADADGRAARRAKPAKAARSVPVAKPAASAPGRSGSGSHRKQPVAGTQGRPASRHAKPAPVAKPEEEPEDPSGEVLLPLTTTPKRKFRPLKVSLVVLNVLLLLAVLTAAAALGFTRYRLAQLKTYDLGDDGLVAPPVGAPFNVLLVGSDSRANQEHPEVNGQRSDTMMVVRLDPVHETAAVLSIPRDLRVLDGKGNVERINAKFSGKGAEAPKNLIKGIQADLGIPIHHYVQVDFESFKAIVDSIDGVNIYLSEPVRDTMSGFGPAGPGCVHLNGEQSLAYARSRHMELKNAKTGKWGNDVGADGERIKRQQDLLRRIVRKSVDKGLTNPAVANRLIDAMVKNVTVDSAMTTARMKTIVQQMRNVNAGKIPMYTLPGTDVTRSGGDYKGGGGYDGLRLLPGATPILAQFGSKLVVGDDFPFNKAKTTTTVKGAQPTTTVASEPTTAAPAAAAPPQVTADTKPPQGSDPTKDCPV